MNSDHYRKMYITLYPQISSFVAVNNYQSDNFHHKTNTPLVVLGEGPTELKDRKTEQGSRDLRKAFLKLEFTEHITRMLMVNLSSSGASHTSSSTILLVVWSAKGDGVVLKGKFQLSDDTYRWN